VAAFFTQNLIAVFFFYGLAFFCMGLAIFLELSHASNMYFAKALRPLCWFGIIHGGHEWLEMFLILKGGQGGQFDPGLINGLRVILLASSFIMLFAFGIWLVASNLSNPQKYSLLSLSALIYAIGLVWLLASRPLTPAALTQADVYTRYSLAIPGSVLTAWGLIMQQKRFSEAGLHSFGKDVVIAAMAFALYGGVGQLFASPTALFPSSVLNAEVFMNWVGFPIQVFRAMTAAVAAIFIIRSLRAFEVENKEHIQQLQVAQLAEHHRLEALRAELFQRTVRAQEVERQRIARELHDGTGQTLTALGMGLRGLVDTIAIDPTRASQHAGHLQELATGGLDDLRRMLNGLHPPQLDDLGLVSAIRSLGREVSEHSGLSVKVLNEMQGCEVPAEMRMVLFRIAQEALTNVLRHAHASEVSIRLVCDGNLVEMEVRDNGQGFDDKMINRDPSRLNLGLLGMSERAALIGGTFLVESKPGAGTLIRISVPLRMQETGHA
jgi:signal transduction histidine kinase